MAVKAKGAWGDRHKKHQKTRKPFRVFSYFVAKKSAKADRSNIDRRVCNRKVPGMSNYPTTRLSLLMQVRDHDNAEAWNDFVAIYQPVIYRFGRHRGLQEADAHDLSQTVLAAVADKIGDWQPDSGQAKFRTWIARIARNQAVSMYRRRRADTAHGGSSMVARLQQQPAKCDEAEELDNEYHRELFRHAARKVRQQFEETTWQAFWRTTVEGLSIGEVARSLGRSAGSIYTARSRVMRRLQETVRELDCDGEPTTTSSSNGDEK